MRKRGQGGSSGAALLAGGPKGWRSVNAGRVGEGSGSLICRARRQIRRRIIASARPTRFRQASAASMLVAPTRQIVVISVASRVRARSSREARSSDMGRSIP